MAKKRLSRKGSKSLFRATARPEKGKKINYILPVMRGGIRL